eukprot:scaffold68734_cov63-Phaeocystis_antarctica.AAC.3
MRIGDHADRCLKGQGCGRAIPGGHWRLRRPGARHRPLATVAGRRVGSGRDPAAIQPPRTVSLTPHRSIHQNPFRQLQHKARVMHQGQLLSRRVERGEEEVLPRGFVAVASTTTTTTTSTTNTTTTTTTTTTTSYLPRLRRRGGLDYYYYHYYYYYHHHHHHHFTCRGFVAVIASTFSSAAVASHVSTCSRSLELRLSSLSFLARTWARVRVRVRVRVTVGLGVRAGVRSPP